ncbi:spore cortex-lytic enzyme [Clostridium thermopalmarium]|uniref:Spore cortex-lytic enzyme n=1 Tax=Clostridium thermopalmarium DSM 5974 TaxID=1121340 RepID=A0A2T0AV01_9CLOT|nr:spore cortex-lytic enzyme [Clostridium thermopalmarium]MBE6043803.1 spore cortex-lytic enzyme [Clostridium thermopalmarium]PRR74414.1 Spore cortex-lytic enzyme precursor [Clostridium thermopalmarium DSM 5974]PVZ21639.1 N-acetylmuramoyl-L-alanine amidase [Clostridium thermopalmarium DSM 5974]
MKNRLGWKRISILIIVIMFSYVSTSRLIIPYCNSVKTAVYKYGSKDAIVTEIQRRLIAWGYYKGNMDGIYGYETYLAVKEFQRKNGLTVDGIAGNATLAALGINPGPGGGSSAKTSTASSNAASSNNSDLMLLARFINGEARGEPYEGQVAVGAVILNRVRHPDFPNTIAGVVYQPGAFTAVVDGQIHAEMQESSIKAARDALNGWDPSGGALYYFNPRTATSAWIWSRPLIKVIGQHRFCK